MGYAPVEPDGSVRIKVPANVAFQISVLDGNARRISPDHAAWLQVRPGEILTCNGCHTPGTAQNPRSHGRQGLFNSAYAGAPTSGTAFPNTASPFLPLAGETMAQARARTSCASDSPRCIQMNPSVNVYYKDVWTNPAVRAPDTSVQYSYADLATPAPNTSCADSPTGASNWKSNCRSVINYSRHIQALWDLKRPLMTIVTAGVTLSSDHCSGCHTAVSAANTAQVPAGQLNLTTADSDTPPQPLSYRHLLFPHARQQVIMGALVSVPGPPDAAGNPTTVAVGPFMDAGSANGTLSSAFLGRFAPGSASTHARWLSPAELRLISEWLDIGAQFFNNPFDLAAPVN
jgi:hypothetical protein